ncbi:MAG: L-fucose/L-arabinose isomerase family protein [Clostridiales bacterium]|jgi:L-fucose isomerase-like protein|nr:L-fucose/L-arabinose isomerase family protein [Clostridiales bacterium]
MFNNIPEVKLGIIAVSRDCFVISLSEKRRERVAAEYLKRGYEVFESKVVVENEKDMLKAVNDVKLAGCNALVVLLGNFGPETPETLIAKYFDGPVMYAASAEESGEDLINGRGDAYCGMLNCSYNLGLRKLKAVIPEYPVGTYSEVCDMIEGFVPVARAIIGLKGLKVITFGPRPQDFFACNAPIKALYDIGVEIQENSELDLLVSFKEHANDERIESVAADMAAELGENGNSYPDILNKLAQFELTLLDWAVNNKGASDYVVFANKCWPAFSTEFGFMPCYVNSRLASMGMPVACEVDIYGAVSEYIAACITEDAVTILDINNSVPADIYDKEVRGKFEYTDKDIFMGFHCGNTPIKKLTNGAMKYQLIMNRLIESGNTPDVTRGTLEGDIIPGNITFFRLQSAADTTLHAYVAQGEILPVDTRSFGGIGIFAISDMGRFYRNVLIAKRYPHHGAVAFSHIGKALYTVFDYLGVTDIEFNRPAGMLYEKENPFN